MASVIEWIQKWMKLIHIIIFRDIRSLYLFFVFRIKFFWYRRQNKVLIDLFDENVRKNRNKTAIIYYDQYYTFQDVANLANRISNWIESSLQLGHDEQWELFHQVNHNDNSIDGTNTEDVSDQSKITNQLDDDHPQIGLLFGNIPELSSFLIGIARVRCSTVLFNTNHRQDTLINAFQATNCRVFIFESKYLSAIQDVVAQLPDIRFFMYNRNASKDNIQIDFCYNGLTRQDLQTGNKKALDQAAQFSALLNSYPITPVLKKYRYKWSDRINYVFTSGTTSGNIKASPTDNIRQLVSYLSQFQAFGINENDNVYICLPCYHSFACVIGLNYMLIGGSTITLASKFSASKFWKNCCQYECTAALYIGETCRYLLAQPVRSEETKHSLRIMIGLGLKKEIWSEFKTRFNIKRIGEFYGSTEGNIQIYNIDSVEGSCGFIPYYFGSFIRFLFHIFLVKVDPRTMEIARGRDGLCMFAKPGDTGMLVGEISASKTFSEFLGYTLQEESSKKIARNIRNEGDYAFISSDLFEMDFFGNLYFKDRTGDTFRWKGENVSTTQIENIASQFLNHNDCVVYGVGIPNYDGCAGMIAISDQQIDLQKFYQFMKARVPEYAIPKFIRITNEIQTTTTFKYIKYPLRMAGFNLEQMKPDDRLFYFDQKCSQYVPMDHDSHKQILTGNIQIS